MTVGAILFVALVGLNAVLEPGGPGPRIVQDTPKAKLVRHDPRASLVERLREEEAAQKASRKSGGRPGAAGYHNPHGARVRAACHGAGERDPGGRGCAAAAGEADPC